MFTRMDQSTKEEWDHIYNEHLPHVFDMPKRTRDMNDGIHQRILTDIMKRRFKSVNRNFRFFQLKSKITKGWKRCHHLPGFHLITVLNKVSQDHLSATKEITILIDKKDVSFF